MDEANYSGPLKNKWWSQEGMTTSRAFAERQRQSQALTDRHDRGTKAFIMLVVRMQFGSHIYGTSTPQSDLDYKAVYVPPAEDILLQRVKNTVTENSKKGNTERNAPGDIDIETFSLQRYLELLLQGQTVAVDMLFTPDSFLVHKTPIWAEIRAKRERFIHSGYSAFAGYCKQQANKYGIKGSRVNAVRSILEWLEQFPAEERLGDVIPTAESGLLRVWLKDESHIAVVESKAPNGRLEKHLEVCNRKVPFHARVKYARQVYQRIFDEYGSRALQAEKHEGIDWKALMHAVRICHQSKELLATGHVTFPRPEAPTLLRIRKGEVPYAEVAQMIEEGLAGMERASAESKLRREPDHNSAEWVVFNAYRDQVRWI